ncbi:hypothetical protein ASF01_03025 [Stenotrophomonas sp. Leaf70]|nr:hypothetical protein ASF01_03025 [Stenotrophomonas sp. Leaf70]
MVARLAEARLSHGCTQLWQRTLALNIDKAAGGVRFGLGDTNGKRGGLIVNWVRGHSVKQAFADVGQRAVH